MRLQNNLEILNRYGMCYKMLDILLDKSCDPGINFFQHDMNIQNLNKPYISSVIRQKGESQNGCLKKTKHAKFSEKMTISYSLCTGGKKCPFFGKFGVLCFLQTPVLRFALLPYYRRYYLMYF